MKKTILYLFLFFELFYSKKNVGQTVLNPGDIAFIGFSTSGNWNDYITLVTFTDLYTGTVFYYTDNPYKSGAFCTGGLEHCIQFTVTGYIIAGTIISYDDGGSDCPSVGAVALSNTTSNCGAITAACSATGTAGTNAGLNSKGDNGFIFQGSYASPSFICAIKNGSKWKNAGSASCTDQDNTELPATLTDGTNALWTGSGSCRGLNYTCPAVAQNISAFQASIYAGTPSTGSYTNWTCTTGSSGIQLPNAISTCSFTLATAPSCVLPVELSEFKATKNPQGVQLNWTTLTEINNNYFTIEKSVDGVFFKELTQVKGVGNSEVTKHYTILDENTFDRITYYRLKQTDFNGNHTYFKTLAVTDDTKTVGQINLYPNPVTELTEISFYAYGITISTIDVANYLGSSVYSKTIETQKGLNKIKLSLTDIPSGIYYLKITGLEFSNNNGVLKLIKQ